MPARREPRDENAHQLENVIQTGAARPAFFLLKPEQTPPGPQRRPPAARFSAARYRPGPIVIPPAAPRPDDGVPLTPPPARGMIPPGGPAFFFAAGQVNQRLGDYDART